MPVTEYSNFSNALKSKGEHFENEQLHQYKSSFSEPYKKSGLKAGLSDDLIDEDVIRRTKEHEGSSSYMYLDSKGNVTVGVGKMLPDAESAKSLTFWYDQIYGDRYATSYEIEDAFSALKKLTFGKSIGREVFNPDKNPVLRKVYMDEGTQNQLLRSDMSRSYKELHGD